MDLRGADCGCFLTTPKSLTTVLSVWLCALPSGIKRDEKSGQLGNAAFYLVSMSRSEWPTNCEAPDTFVSLELPGSETYICAMFRIAGAKVPPVPLVAACEHAEGSCT